MARLAQSSVLFGISSGWSLLIPAPEIVDKAAKMRLKVLLGRQIGNHIVGVADDIYIEKSIKLTSLAEKQQRCKTLRAKQCDLESGIAARILHLVPTLQR